MIRTNARQQGGAVVMTIPADILKLRHIKAGDPLGIDVTPDGFVVRKTGLPETFLATSGPVVCEPLGIRFPILYRGEVTTTFEDLQAVGVENDPDITVGTWALYSLKTDQRVIGSVSWKEVSHIFRDDRDESFAIRHHRSVENASSYLDAVMDLTFNLSGDDEEYGQSLFETEGGVFTLTPMKTRSSWPGPTVAYFAEIPSDRYAGTMDCWAHAVGPNGEVFELPGYSVPE